MRGASRIKQSDIGRDRQILARTVGGYERCAGATKLNWTVVLEYFRTGVELSTLLHQAISLARNGVGGGQVRKWKLITRREMGFVLARIITGFGPAIVGVSLAGPANQRQHPVEDDPNLVVGVETLPKEITQVTTGLRNASRQRGLDSACQGVGITRGILGFVAQERDQVARGEESQSHRFWIGCGVIELVN